MCDRPQCMKPGRITSNGYLNFLREFRRRCCGLGPVETVVEGSKAWNRLTRAQRNKFVREAACVKRRRRCPRKRKKRKPVCRKRRKPRCPRKRKPACPRKRKPSCPRKRKPSCPRKRKPRCPPKKRKCCKYRFKPGPPTNNPFLNFLRYIRQHNCNLNAHEVLMLAARKWRCMSECDKRRFRQMACRHTCSERRKCSKFCREYRQASQKLRRQRKKRMCGGS